MHVRVFESQRSPGGRLATRRFAAASFDHGAQYLTATDTKFRKALESAQIAGAAANWRPNWQGGDGGRELWVGYPAMNSLPRFLAQDHRVEYGARILRLERGRGGLGADGRPRVRTHGLQTRSCSRYLRPRPRRLPARARRSPRA